MEEVCQNNFVEELKLLCKKNANFYEKDETENGQRLRLGFLGIMDHIDTILPLVANIENIMSTFDFDENTPGNGYRSFVVVVNACFKHALQVCNYVDVNKESMIFRKGFYMKEVEAVSHMIASLISCFKHLHTLLGWSETGNLFPSPEHNAEVLLQQADTVNMYAFYGRCLGIQFCTSVQPLLKMISILMASFSEIYYNFESFSARAQGLFLGGKFFIDPELRAQRIVNISQHANIDFCKSFWFLTESELMKRIPDFVCRSLAINTEIKIPPEPLEINNSLGISVKIPIPTSHIPVNSIQVRLLSSSRREGMIAVWSDSNKKNKLSSPSKNLIFHCHGGGFVAQSSKSHEVYLRDWACCLDVPIVSVDYSLAPEAPFPRALEEVFYSYCWVLKNAPLLGSTGENIIFAGDSAGANLVLGVALKCIEYNIRIPSGIFVAYVPVIVSSIPSPSRMLCLMDPLLPIGFLLRCLKAYACPNTEVDEKGIPAEEYEAANLKNNVDNEAQPFAAGSASNAQLNLNLPDSDSGVSNCYKAETYTFTNATTDDGQKSNSNFLNEKNQTPSEKPRAPERNYRNTFFNVRKKVSSLVSNAFRIELKDVDKALTGNDVENVTDVRSLKDFKFSVPKDPYMSPYWASDDVLKKLPPISICSVEFDPCLDDCVTFAKKLKKIGNTVTLDVLKGLPHGFLNLSKVNKDAEEGAKFCIKRIQELLSKADSSWENCSKPCENKESDNGIALES